MPSLHRVAVAMVAAALCAPAAVQAGTTVVSPAVDLVSPDARDAASRPAHQIDLVSPDARDGVPAHTTVVPHARTVEAPSTGFEWGDAAIGGGTTLALVLLLGVGAMTVRPGRRPLRSR